MRTARTHNDRTSEAAYPANGEPVPSDVPFQITGLNGSLGAEITGFDVGAPLSADAFARIHRAYLEHHVVVFRKQRITPQQHIGFSRQFGKLMIQVLHQFHLPGHPEILTISNVIDNGKPIGLGGAGKYWHSDISYLAGRTGRRVSGKGGLDRLRPQPSAHRSLAVAYSCCRLILDGFAPRSTHSISASRMKAPSVSGRHLLFSTLERVTVRRWGVAA